MCSWNVTDPQKQSLILYYFKLCVLFKAISEFKQKLQSGNAQFGSKLAMLLYRVTLKFDRWHSKTIGNVFAILWFVRHFVAIGDSNWSYSRPETLNSIKIEHILCLVTFEFNKQPKKQLGISFIVLQALCIISKPLVNSNWSYGPEMPKLGQTLLLHPCS